MAKTKINGIIHYEEKKFMMRRSPLNNLMDLQDFRSLYKLSISILISLFIASLSNDYLTKGQTSFRLKILMKAFSTFHEGLIIWLFMFVLVVSSYVGFLIWAIGIQSFGPKSKLKLIWNKLGLGAIILYYVTLIVVPTFIIRYYDQSIATSVALLMELTRFLMKVHAFIRTCVPVVLQFKPHSDNEEDPMPSFKQFIYFLFVPTLVYRNEYPRTEKINWKFVSSCFVEILLILLFVALLLEKFFMQPFENTCLEKTNWAKIGAQIFANAGPGLLLLFCAFYLVQHSWQNGFAEMLRFGDRLFYKDWWNSKTYARYFRTWNLMVHDWLHTYIYKDVYEILVPGNAGVAKFCAFLVSSVFHEFILSFTFKMFFPVMFVQFFVFGTLLALMDNADVIGNVFLWTSLAHGQSIMISLYGIELYARYNCPLQDESLINYFVPRIFTCDCI